CKLIVLDQHIQSMTEFKQIIGRGTRVNEEFGKSWFTIMDFKKATELFSDKAFDGEPVVIYEPQGDDPIVPPENDGETDDGTTTDPTPPNPPLGEDDDDTTTGEPPKKYVVNNVAVKIIGERVQFYDNDGS